MSTTPITLICGIPGTGKSTFARWIEEKKGFLHLDVEKQGALQRASVESAWMGWLGISRRPLHPAGDGSLGDVKAQHEQFAVNARRAPGWVLRHHTEDQLSNVRRQFFSTDPFSRL